MEAFFGEKKKKKRNRDKREGLDQDEEVISEDQGKKNKSATGEVWVRRLRDICYFHEWPATSKL